MIHRKVWVHVLYMYIVINQFTIIINVILEIFVSPIFLQKAILEIL